VKFSLALLSGLAFIAALRASADEVLPPRQLYRYKRMVDHSPFAVATAAALPEATPDFAKDLYVANAAHSLESDMATIVSSSDQNFKKYLTTKEPVDGYGIASIEWSDRVGATKVTISKDGKFATLTFNQAVVSQAASGRPPAVGQMQTGAGQVSDAQRRKATQRNKKAVADAMMPDLEQFTELLPPPPPVPPFKSRATRGAKAAATSS
jgi:hypothetical protein